MAATKININVQKWLFQIDWKIINAVRLFSAFTLKHRTQT